MTTQSGSLSWDIKGNALTKFMNATNGQEFTSEMFNVGSFSFSCKVYPNGRKKEQKGCVMLYFVLQTSLANKISKISVKARLYCTQTLCDWKHVQHLKKDNAGIGWHSKNLLLSEAKQYNHLNFICQITILRIEYKAQSIKSLGTNIYYKLSKMNIYTKYEWNIDSNLLHAFQRSHNGKFYHSPDYNYDSWCTSIAPNGTNPKDVGNVKVGLQLLQLPPGIGKIKTKFTFSSNFQNIKCDGKKDFSLTSTFIAWTDGTLLFNDLCNIQSKISFNIEIYIIQIYDDYNKEIPTTQWEKYGFILDNTNSNDNNDAEYKNNINFILESDNNYNLLSSPASLKSTPSPNTSTLLRSPMDGDRTDNVSITDPITINQTGRSYYNDLNMKYNKLETLVFEDRTHINLIGKDLTNLQKSQNRVQHQQFNQSSIFKQYINDLSSTMQSLNNEIVSLKNRINKMENQIIDQQMIINDYKRSDIGINKNIKSSSKSVSKVKRKSLTVSKELATWLKYECKFPQYILLFAQNGYDTMEIVCEMSKYELDEIGIKLKGHQFKILNEISKLKYTRTHHRNKGLNISGSINAYDINGMDNAIKYLSPVPSPNGASNVSSSPTLHSYTKLKLQKNINSNSRSTDDIHIHDNSINNGTYNHRINILSFPAIANQSPSHSQSVSYTATSTTYNNSFNAHAKHKKPSILLVDSPSSSHFSHKYSPKSKYNYHNSPYIPHISNMWECKSCHNSNLGTLDKCEFCDHQR